MPHKNIRCRKCKTGHTRQIKFIKPDYRHFGDFVIRGLALFECKSCGHKFESPHGRILTKNYDAWKKKKQLEEKKQDAKG